MICPKHGTFEDTGTTYKTYKCKKCDTWLRPDIVWFGDMLKQEVMQAAVTAMGTCDLFISIGTSGVVYPAAGFPQIAKDNNAFCIEINPEASPISNIYDQNIREPAGTALPRLITD
jgi:NAD-dependent deacetylase